MRLLLIPEKSKGGGRREGVVPERKSLTIFT